MATQLHISLSDALKQWVDEQASAGGFTSVGDFVECVLTEERKRRLRQMVERELRVGIESGPARPMTAEDWEYIRRESERRINERQPSS